MTPRRWVYLASGLVAACVLSFLAGRFSHPAKVTETTTAAKVEEKHADAKIETSTDTVQSVHRVIVRRTAPATPPPPAAPGCPQCPACPAVKEETITEDIGTKVDEDQRVDLHVNDRIAETTTTTKVTEYAKPGWSVGASALWSPSHLSTRPERVSVDIDRRIVGTLWLGPRASVEWSPDRGSRFALGVGARVEF